MKTLLKTWLLLTATIAFADTGLILTTPDHIRFGLIGAKPPAPSPTVFFLGGGVEESLTEPQYAEAQRELGSAVLYVTIDLGHGTDHRPGEPASLQAWRYRLDHGEDLIGDCVGRARAVLDYLIRQGFTDPSRVAVFGTSRGGFMAFHFAAAEPRVVDDQKSGRSYSLYLSGAEVVQLNEKHGGGLVWPDDDVVLSAGRRVQQIRQGPARLFKALLPTETTFLLVDVRVRGVESLDADTREDVEHLEGLRRRAGCCWFTSNVIVLHVMVFRLRSPLSLL